MRDPAAHSVVGHASSPSLVYPVLENQQIPAVTCSEDSPGLYLERSEEKRASLKDWGGRRCPCILSNSGYIKHAHLETGQLSSLGRLWHAVTPLTSG